MAKKAPIAKKSTPAPNAAKAPATAPSSKETAKRRDALRDTVEKHGLSYRKLAMESSVKERLIRLTVENDGELSEAAWQALAASCPPETPLHQLLAPVVSAPIAKVPAKPEAPALQSAAEALSHVIRVPLKLLRENPHNYRQTYDPGAMKELEDSILAEGVLQNLVTFPISKDGTYTINSGNRRFRALKGLEAKRKIDGDYLVHIFPKKMTADEALALAIVENLQRQDVDPLEEADGFAQLEKLKWSTERIADFVGIARRTVQDRLQLAKGLFDEGRAALREKKITIDQARAIVTCPDAKLQTEMLAAATRQYAPLDGPQLRAWLKSRLPSVKHAGFDLELYKGEYVGAGKDRLFVDKEAFIKLQRQAAKDLAAELRKTWSKVTLIKENGYFWASDYVKEEDPAKGQAFVEIDERSGWKIKTHKGYAPKPDADLDELEGDDEEAAQRAAAQAKLREERQEALKTFSTALEDKFRERPANLLRITLLAMMLSYEIDLEICAPELQANTEDMKLLAEKLDMEEIKIDWNGVGSLEVADRIWRGLLNKSDGWVYEMIASFCARDIMGRLEYSQVADVNKLIVDSFGVEIPAPLRAHEAKPDEATETREPTDVEMAS